jgi:THO complex subunit 7
LGKTSERKCSEQLMQYFEVLSSKNLTDPDETSLECLLWELECVLFDAKKSALVRHTCNRELQMYNDLHRELDEQIERVATEMESLKNSVMQEKRIRQYKEEYESLATVINTYPSGQQLAADGRLESDQLEASEENLRQISSLLELRTKQFALLLRTIRDLRTTLEEDQEDLGENQPMLIEE